jgi:hypothetical protein
MIEQDEMNLKRALQCIVIGIFSDSGILGMEMPPSLHCSLTRNPEIVRVLIRSGANVFTCSEPGSFKFTHNGTLITYNDDGSLISKLISVYLLSRCIYPSVVLEKLKILLLSGAPLPQGNDLILRTIRGFFPTTPLVVACIVGNIADVENLISAFSPSDNEQEEALAYAVGQGHQKIVDLLLTRLLLKNTIRAPKIQEWLSNVELILWHATPEITQKYKVIREMLEAALQLPRRLALSSRTCLYRH